MIGCLGASVAGWQARACVVNMCSAGNTNEPKTLSDIRAVMEVDSLEKLVQSAESIRKNIILSGLRFS